MPYKFNGKEMDEETGLYYYGARYMNPVASMFLGVDPLAEKYPSIGGYVYCAGNPVKLVDPDGKRIKTEWYMNDQFKGSYISPKNFRDALKKFAKTSFGRKLFADFTPKGSYFMGVKGNGKYSKHDLILQIDQYSGNNAGDSRTSNFFDTNSQTWIIAQTQEPEVSNNKISATVIFDGQYNSDDLLETINHELSLHLSKYETILDRYEKTGKYTDIVKLWKSSPESLEHHDLISSQRLIGSKHYMQSRKELVKLYPKLSKVFNQNMRDYEKQY